jgi:hypothetical protein
MSSPFTSTSVSKFAVQAILQYLKDAGLEQTLEALKEETYASSVASLQDSLATAHSSFLQLKYQSPRARS